MAEKLIVFNGIKYHLCGGYYRRQRWGVPGPSNLHRAIWEHHNGPIPEGWFVHHKDGDSLNNDIQNLELVTQSGHARIHATELHAQGRFGNTPDGREKAKQWHNSEEGQAWHHSHWERTIKLFRENPTPLEKTCKHCGEVFATTSIGRSPYCKPACRDEAYRQRRRRSPTPTT